MLALGNGYWPMFCCEGHMKWGKSFWCEWSPKHTSPAACSTFTGLSIAQIFTFSQHVDHAPLPQSDTAAHQTLLSSLDSFWKWMRSVQRRSMALLKKEQKTFFTFSLFQSIKTFNCLNCPGRVCQTTMKYWPFTQAYFFNCFNRSL